MSAANIFRLELTLKAFAIFFLFFFFISGFLVPIKSDELQVLLRFKSTLGKSNSPTAFDSWIEDGSPCNFSGIVCNSRGFVKEINLNEKQLSGSVPFNSICDGLRALQKISLISNNLYGRIGDGLNKCTELKHLDLGRNFFSGDAPDLSQLKELEFLRLNGSAYSGVFPWKSLANLTKLSFLSLGDNPFDEAPFPIELLSLHNLNYLYLTNCSLQGQIPEGIGNLTKLEDLELSYNNLFGEIPKGISRLKNLKQLELYSNRFSGNFPEGFGNLTSLGYLDVSQNLLEGGLSELKFLTNLTSLQLFQNKFYGKVPEEFGEFKNLRELSLYSNKLTGNLPQKLGSWSEFSYIDASDNLLTGTIPPYMCAKKKMIGLLLLQNRFTGGIPETYGSCSSLVRFRISNNSLSGSVPVDLWSLPYLTIIDLAFNRFEGAVSPSIEDAKSLVQIYLSNNLFSGELTAPISKVSSLVVLDLSWNHFSGNIPEDIGQLKNLNTLFIQSNSFSGTIPKSLGYCLSLNDVNMAGNLISGEIPNTLGSLPSLNSLNLSTNKLSGRIPASLSSLKLSLLDLSNNSLTGRVPDSLSTGSFEGNPRLCSRAVRNLQPCLQDSGKLTSASIRTVVSCFIAGSALMMASLACFLILKLRRRTHDAKNITDGKIDWDIKPFHLITFSEQDIVNSIKQENLIGKGGSGNVYKVTLKDRDILAVKHIRKSPSPDSDKVCRSSAPILARQKGNRRGFPEYDAEIAALSSVRHVNVVKLFCSISSEDSNLLVYEYLPNGSLWDKMHSGNKKIELCWAVRFEIAVGAAKGLEYLHHGCGRPMIHRDVKSSNILLDENLKPRIADFGLAKMVNPDTCSSDSTHVIAGTYGYIAPEYGYTKRVNEKSDVYSFGVVLMELVTGRKAVEPLFGENRDIVMWVCAHIWHPKETGGGGVEELLDPAILESERECAFKVLRIAIQCTAKLPALRPSMRMVVQMLEEAGASSLVVETTTQ